MPRAVPDLTHDGLMVCDHKFSLIRKSVMIMISKPKHFIKKNLWYYSSSLVWVLPRCSKNSAQLVALCCKTFRLTKGRVCKCRFARLTVNEANLIY